MKMQEVITKIREIVPQAMSAASTAKEQMDVAYFLFQDFSKCTSSEARVVLEKRLEDLMDTVKIAVGKMFAHVSSLFDLNSGYTRRLGPKQRKDDSRQENLPGFETPSFETSGRHG